MKPKDLPTSDPHPIPGPSRSKTQPHAPLGPLVRGWGRSGRPVRVTLPRSSLLSLDNCKRGGSSVTSTSVCAQVSSRGVCVLPASTSERFHLCCFLFLLHVSLLFFCFLFRASQGFCLIIFFSLPRSAAFGPKRSTVCLRFLVLFVFPIVLRRCPSVRSLFSSVFPERRAHLWKRNPKGQRGPPRPSSPMARSCPLTFPLGVCLPAPSPGHPQSSSPFAPSFLFLTSPFSPFFSGCPQTFLKCDRRLLNTCTSSVSLLPAHFPEFLLQPGKVGILIST